MEKIISTTWHPELNLVVTRLSGLLNANDIAHWKATIDETFSGIPDNTTFKILVNLYGFKAVDFEVHKYYRNIIPLLLAAHGYRIGYLDMFPEATVELTNTRGIRCIAMANVDQDETKMNDYNARFSNASEHYFTDPDSALSWIKQTGNSANA